MSGIKRGQWTTGKRLLWMFRVLVGAYGLVILIEAAFVVLRGVHPSSDFLWRAAFWVFVPGAAVFQGFLFLMGLASMPRPAGDFVDQKTGKVRVPMIVNFWTVLGFVVVLLGGALILYEIF